MSPGASLRGQSDATSARVVQLRSHVVTLISVDQLARRSPDSDVVVCDVRFYLDDHDRGRREYEAAHLPGAVFVDLHHDLAGGPGGGRHPLPSPDDFARLLARLGIGRKSFVVAYDDAGGAFAARLWWMLRSIGHTDVAVLDGGVRAWTAAGRPLTDENPDARPVDAHNAVSVPSEWTGTVDADDVIREIAAGTTVIDARAASRYRGDVEPIDARAGHIPGAINRFHGDTFGDDGTQVDPGELSAHFEGIGASPIVYCGSGVTACRTLLALGAAGVDDARLYPGSWSEWSADPGRPVATGDD